MSTNPNATSESSVIRSLPAPSNVPADQARTKELSIDSGNAIKLDELGPMVVNSDGTLSRISNWVNMTDAEKTRTLRVLGARNQLRIAEKKQANENNLSNS